ncbi:MAG: cupin domain-containing protein [Chitinophagaceae bacterium]
MLTTKEYIDSGILEQYVLGNASPEECKEVEMRAAADPVIRQEIDKISETLEAMAMANAVEPDPVIKPFLLATIDFYQRIENGEPVSVPPLLNEKSKLADYTAWLNRSDMVSPGTDDIFAKIIGYTEEAITAIIWLKDFTPPEVHNKEFEKFLIVEGTCNITVGDEVNQLVPGDYFVIPLHKSHFVKVTSSMPCKIILQRIAA